MKKTKCVTLTQTLNFYASYLNFDASFTHAFAYSVTLNNINHVSQCQHNYYNYFHHCYSLRNDCILFVYKKLLQVVLSGNLSLKRLGILKVSSRSESDVPSLQASLSTRSRYHGGRRPSSDDSFHSPTVIPPSALDKLSIMKRYHRRRTCSHTSRCRSPTMVTLHDTRFVECRWWNDGWTVKTVVT